MTTKVTFMIVILSFNINLYIFAPEIENVTRFIYIFFCLVTIITSDVAMQLIVFEDSEFCLVDSPIENETEKESKENSKEESKIEISPGDLSFHYKGLYTKYDYLIKYHFSDSYLEIFTPPPEYS